MRSDWKTAIAGVGVSLAAGIAYKAIRYCGCESTWRGKVVLITGGSRGLGFSLAREFGKCGANVAICARDEQELQEACRKLSLEKVKATPFVTDVTEFEKLESFVMSVTEKMGRIDVLINNAGLIRVGPFSSTKDQDYEEAMNLMFWAPLHLSRAVLPQMQNRQSGSIVNIASVGGRVSIPHLLPYSCAKFALVAFSTGLSAEIKASGVHVMTVLPGLMRTGSYLNAQFAGDSKHEFAWFGILGNLPGFTVGAEFAAEQIRRALEKKKYEHTISLPASVLIGLDNLLPNVSRAIMTGLNQLLPGGDDQGSATGKDVNQHFGKAFQATTALGRQAAATHNQ